MPLMPDHNIRTLPHTMGGGGRPRTPEPHPVAPDVSGGTDRLEGAPRQRNQRRHRPGGGAPVAPPDEPSEGGAAARYGPLGSASLRRHVTSPWGAGKLIRRPAAHRTMRKLCTLALPALSHDGTEPGGAETATAAASFDDDPHHQQKPSSPPPLDRTASLDTPNLASLGSDSAAGSQDEYEAQSVSSTMVTGSTAPGSTSVGIQAGGSSRDLSSLLHHQAYQHSKQPQSIERSFPPPRANFAPGCRPQIVFGRYVAAATDDGRVCLFAARQFEANRDLDRMVPVDSSKSDEDRGGEQSWNDIEQTKELIDEAEDEAAAVPPLSVVGPFRVGGSQMSRQRNRGGDDDYEEDNAASVVALAATPAQLSLLSYRQTMQASARDESKGEREVSDDSPPPPATRAGHDFLGHMAILTLEGDVHIVEVQEPRGSRDVDTSRTAPPPPEVQVIMSFSSMEYCASCICIRQAEGIEDGSTPTFRIAVGHESGIIVEFELQVIVDEPLGGASGVVQPMLSPGKAPMSGQIEEGNPSVNLERDAFSAAVARGAKSSPEAVVHRKTSQGEGEGVKPRSPLSPVKKESFFGVAPSTPSPRGTYSLPRLKIIWAGYFDTSIRSLASVGVALHEHSDLASYQRTHLVVGLVQRSRGQSGIALDASCPPASSTIEVCNVHLAEKRWRETCSSDSPNTIDEGLDPISLDDYCVWPGVGMELRDASDLSGRYGGELEDSGTKANSYMRRVECLASQDGLNPAFAISISGGTVAIADTVKQPDGSFGWGIANSFNQIFLAGTSVGIGFLGGEGLSDISHHAVFCMQGGAVVVAPVVSPKRSSSDYSLAGQVFSYHFPFEAEGDSDDAVRFLHGFSAGNLCLNYKGTERNQSVLAFSWAGGVVDLYACDLPQVSSFVDESILAPKDAILDSLLDSGSDLVLALVKQVQGMSGRESILDDDLWRLAWNDCKVYCNDTDGIEESILGGIRRNDENLSSFRRLLLSLI